MFSRLLWLPLLSISIACGQQRRILPANVELYTGGHEAAPQRDPACDQSAITLRGLLDEMVDLSCLGHAPLLPFVSRTVTSHDRASDGAAHDHPAWFANSDVLMLEAGVPATLLDVQGAGVVTRIWSANPSGALRIYVDGSRTPVVEADFLALTRGDVAPFRTPFAFTAGGGRNLYFPIPFARSCRITLSGGPGPVYFHIGYRQYAPGTPIEAFSAEALDAAKAALADVSDRLNSAKVDAPARPAGQQQSFELDTARPGARSVTLAAPADGGVIRQLRIWPGRLTPGLLRGTILTLTFDGEPSVRVPLGDFFAAGVALHDVNAVPIGASEGGPLVSRWPMPFAREVQIGLESTGAGELEALLEVGVEPSAWNERQLHFHARWQPPSTMLSKPPRDWTLAELQGPGHYVGNVLNVVNRVPSWWGEGDEKIYQDGEAFPSHFGTGTEDYYGYAWCSNEPFTTAYVGQPLAGSRRNFGYTSLYRFHVLDRIPFQKSLRFDLEVQHWGPAADITYDAVSFWYARPDCCAQDAPLAPELFRIPALLAEPPADVPEGRYRCG